MREEPRLARAVTAKEIDAHGLLVLDRVLLDALAGRTHTKGEWYDLESDGILCLGYRNGRDGEHEHWPQP